MHVVDDPCAATPCANDGTCTRTGLTDFSCVCERNWGGALCKSELHLLTNQMGPNVYYADSLVCYD